MYIYVPEFNHRLQGYSIIYGRQLNLSVTPIKVIHSDFTVIAVSAKSDNTGGLYTIVIVT